MIIMMERLFVRENRLGNFVYDSAVKTLVRRLFSFHLGVRFEGFSSVHA